LPSKLQNISESKNSETFYESKEIAKEGGKIARNARLEAEKIGGRKIIVKQNSKLIENKKDED